MSADYEFPYNAIVLRFGTTTPYFPLSMLYGIFRDPSNNRIFTSIFAYLGYHMFVKDEHRKEVLRAPNGFIANLNISAILKRSSYEEDNPIVDPKWEENRDEIAMQGLRLKFGQSSFMLDMLHKTKDRPIFDASQREDFYWCFCDGNGENKHAKLLEKLREESM